MSGNAKLFYGTTTQALYRLLLTSCMIQIYGYYHGNTIVIIITLLQVLSRQYYTSIIPANFAILHGTTSGMIPDSAAPCIHSNTVNMVPDNALFYGTIMCVTMVLLWVLLWNYHGSYHDTTIGVLSWYYHGYYHGTATGIISALLSVLIIMALPWVLSSSVIKPLAIVFSYISIIGLLYKLYLK